MTNTENAKIKIAEKIVDTYSAKLEHWLVKYQDREKLIAAILEVLC